jgi:hypothetical protein
MKLRHSSLLLGLTVAVFALCSSVSSFGYERRFTQSYETTTMPKGAWEFEPWFTYKHYSDKELFEFRYEVEYGVSDRFQLAAYLSDWSLTDLDQGGSEAVWHTAGLEGIYSLTNPNTDWLGSALYGEVLIGPEKFVLEGKLLLQKNFGPLAIVYNAVVEAEWEGSDYDQQVGVWENTFGLSYQMSPRFAMGVEATHAVEFEDWAGAGDHVVFAGPNVSYRSKGFYATLAGLVQATDVDGEPEAQVRLLLGFSF